jgi:hypothetical protein
MRVINVVKIKFGVVDEITSFGVFEEQLSQDVAEQAEKKFVEVAKELGCNTDDEDIIEEICSNGYYQPTAQNSVCISWSDI